MNTEKLHGQFISYQLLVTEDVVQAVQKNLATLKTPGSNDKEFDLLAKVARCIMTIPHSNASKERIFSLINKNKTPSGSLLQADDMLSSLLIVKTHIKDPLRWNPLESLIQKVKRATKVYNEQHRH